jgi:thiosulfate/3-mercaptopyruvate sulfurtransferase
MLSLVAFISCALSALPSGETVFVTPAQAASLHAAGALVLDARKSPTSPYVAGAVETDWLDYRDGLLPTGRLDSNLERVAKKLRRLGLSHDRSVLVVGDMHEGWGEEARIWWMLRYLGFEDVFILEGGVRAWVKAGFAVSTGLSEARTGPPLVLRNRSELDATWRDVDRLRTDPKAVVLDAREPNEFAGATPFFEARGGHIPGAKNLPWKTLLTPEGSLRSGAELDRIFKDLGITEAHPVVAYCTGGVRSAFVVAVLHHRGYVHAANYAGSFWEWARRDELPVARPSAGP